MKTVLQETMKKFYAIANEKGLDSLEKSLAFDEYADICGNNWDEETAIEVITNWT